MYEFYIGGLKLPVTPTELEIEVGNANKTLELINTGEINLIKFPKLTGYSFEFELPFLNTTGGSGEVIDAKSVLDHIEDLKKNKKVAKFIVIRNIANTTSFPLEQDVTVEDYTINESGEKFGRMTVSINLKQFRRYKTNHIRDIIKFDEENAPTDKKVTACLKKLELLLDTTLRSGAGNKNRMVATMKKGEKPMAYGQFKFESVVWYMIKHSKGDPGKGGEKYAWIQGTEKDVKVLKDYKTVTVEVKSMTIGKTTILDDNGNPIDWDKK